MNYNTENNYEAQSIAQSSLNSVVYHDISFDISHLATLPISACEDAEALDESFSIVIGKML